MGGAATPGGGGGGPGGGPGFFGSVIGGVGDALGWVGGGIAAAASGVGGAAAAAAGGVSFAEATAYKTSARAAALGARASISGVQAGAAARSRMINRVVGGLRAAEKAGVANAKGAASVLKDLRGASLARGARTGAQAAGAVLKKAVTGASPLGMADLMVTGIGAVADYGLDRGGLNDSEWGDFATLRGKQGRYTSFYEYGTGVATWTRAERLQHRYSGGIRASGRDPDPGRDNRTRTTRGAGG